MPDANCTCRMWRDKGYCHHTGYKPVELPPEAYRKQEPIAIRRMRRWVRENPVKEDK